MSAVKSLEKNLSKSNKQQKSTLSYDERVQGDVRCTVERAADVLSGKWTTLILRDLLSGSKRFGELRYSLAGISPKTLTDRLRALEQQGVIGRTVYPEVPPRVEYTLTEKGHALHTVIDAMAQWGERWT